MKRVGVGKRDPAVGITQPWKSVTCGMLGPGQSSVWLGQQAGKRREEARAGHHGQTRMGLQKL